MKEDGLLTEEGFKMALKGLEGETNKNDS